MCQTCQDCEHELNLTDEYWIDYESVQIELKCDVCGTKFKGVVKQEE